MSVYVDASVNRGWRLGPNSHLLADSLDELHAFAARLGLHRGWFQPGSRSLPHYDLTDRRRAAAVRLGAIEIGRHQLVARMRAHRAKAF